MTAKAVYYDSSYDSSWILPTISKKIKNFLVKQNFSVLNAKNLENFILSFLNHQVENPVIVFSMDKAPHTILNSNDANSIVRKFLDAGGRIVWIGDIPFWNIGKKKTEKKDPMYYQTGAHMAILGVNPVVRTASSEPVRITRIGRRMGISHIWSGVRPIEISKEFGVQFWWDNIKYIIHKGTCIPKAFNIGFKPKDRRIIVLGKSQYLTARPVILLKKKSKFQLRSATISLPPNVDVELNNSEQKEALPHEREFWKTYTNAWFKNFNRVKPWSGFIRIWDYSPTVITQNMLNDLVNVALFGIAEKAGGIEKNAHKEN